MDHHDRNILATRNHKYANSSSNYCQPKANNNRKAVVVCANHLVKRPSKRMRASIYIYVVGEIEYQA